MIHKVEAIDIAFHKALGATLGEWSSDADDKAYRVLNRIEEKAVSIPITDKNPSHKNDLPRL